MNRRTFTLAGFFGAVGAALSKALAYDGRPKDIPTTIIGFDSTVYAIKVGRKLMTLPDGATGPGGWQVYADSEKTAAITNEGIDLKNEIDQHHYEEHMEFLGPDHVLTPPVQREHLALPPIGVARWNAAPDAFRPAISGPTYAKIDDLKDLRDDLDRAHKLPEDVLRGTVFELWRRIDTAIRLREGFCDGHNGPGLGLTAENPMRLMPDGRRLCPYCYKEETGNDVQYVGRDRSQARTI